MKKIFFLFLVAVLSTVGISAQSKTHVIAHRGYWDCEGSAENSITSLKKAIEIGAYGSELDVWLTRDNALVVNHNPTTLDGLKIEDFTAEEICKSKLKNGENIPLLIDYLKAGKDQDKTKLIIELKEQTGLERQKLIARKTIDMVKELGIEDKVEYITFCITTGDELIRLAPNAKVAYLSCNYSPAELKQKGYTGIDFSYSCMKKHPHWYDEAKACGLTINVWTVNKKEQMLELIDKNVDYITTNNPLLLQDLLK